jgi:integrase
MAARKPLLDHELAALHAVLDRFSLRDQAVVGVGLHCGFRASEYLPLSVGAVALGNGTIKDHLTVSRARMKGGQGARKRSVTSRSVPLNAAVKAILQKYFFARFGSGPLDLEAPLFPSRKHAHRLSRWRANVILHAIFEAAGLHQHEFYGTHTLRKTFCRLVHRNTKNDINLTRAVMGHRFCNTTQAYLHVEESEIAQAVLNLPDHSVSVAASQQAAS